MGRKTDPLEFKRLDELSNTVFFSLQGMADVCQKQDCFLSLVVLTRAGIH